jgi:CRISPR/Cas system CMR subunit Cmr4 (Cas7 group RAMP superfamily)
MNHYKLQIHLLSDTTFGRGDGIAGLIDQEVEHDPLGFPYLRGRTLKGLLSEECDNLINVLPRHQQSHWHQVASVLFGRPGSSLDTIASIHVGDACLPEDIRQAVASQIKQGNLQKSEILESLTTIRRQTSISVETGTPDRGSLRSARVVLRDLIFTADLSFIKSPPEHLPEEDLESLLLVGVKALRHLGSARNRGRGHVRCTLLNEQGDFLSSQRLDHFFTPQEVQ